MADPKPGTLHNLRIKRVAIVDMGANFDRRTGDGAHIMLFKSAPSVATVHVDGIATDPDPLKPKEKNVKKSLFQRMLKAVGMTDEKARTAELDAIAKEFPDDADDKPVHKADDAMCKCADCMAKSVAKAAENQAAITKAAGELVASEIAKANESVAKANARVAEVEKTLATEVEKREDVEIREVLKSFSATSVNLDTDVPIFRKMRKSDPAMYDRTIAIMKAQDAIAAKSGAFVDVGSGRDGGAGLDAWNQLEAKADALVEKSTKEMTREKALEKVMLDPANKGLVKAYRAAQQ